MINISGARNDNLASDRIEHPPNVRKEKPASVCCYDVSTSRGIIPCFDAKSLEEAFWCEHREHPEADFREHPK